MKMDISIFPPIETCPKVPIEEKNKYEKNFILSSYLTYISMTNSSFYSAGFIFV